MADSVHPQYEADLAMYRAIVGRPAARVSAPAQAAVLAARPTRGSAAWRAACAFCRGKRDEAIRLARHRAREAFRRLSRLA